MRRLWVFVCLMMVLAVPTTAQIGDPPLPVVEEIAARPRILLTPDYIDSVLRLRAGSNVPTWLTLLDYVNSEQPEADFADHPLEATRSLAVAYLVSDEQSYADRAARGLLELVTRLASHPALTSEATWDADFVDWLTGIALGYDWLYDTFSPADRTALQDVISRAVTVLNDPTRDVSRIYIPGADDTFRFAAYHHLSPRVVWAVTASGLALLGDVSEAADWLDYGTNLFENWIIPGLEDQSGGAWAEGPYYGFSAHWASIQTATALWTARGENYFDDTEWWYNRLAYNMFAYQPTLQTIDDMPAWNYPAVFGDTQLASDDVFLGRAQDLLLTTVYAGTEHAAWMHWFLEQGADLEGRMAVEAFLWRDTTAEGFPTPWEVWYTLRSGHVFLRSDWLRSGQNLDADATLITFNAGDRYAHHQFFDAGNLTIWRAGDDLLVRGGVYSGTGNADSDVNYYARSVAANVPLICDLSENFDGIRDNAARDVWLNDCGQRPTGLSTAINSYNRTAPLHNTGDILRFTVEGNLNYFRANLTSAYNSVDYATPPNDPKVNEVLREFVYLRPGTLVIFDRIRPTDPNATVINPFHFNSQPVNMGQWWQIDAEASRLSVAGVFHAGNVASGFEVAGESITFNADPSGNYQLQFEPLAAADTHLFITVMIADAREADSPPAWTPIVGDGVVGVAWDTWQVMFDDDPNNISNAAFTVAEGVQNVLITGLVPSGVYEVTLPDGTNDNLLADSAGTLYIFMRTTGEIRLRS